MRTRLRRRGRGVGRGLRTRLVISRGEDFREIGRMMIKKLGIGFSLKWRLCLVFCLIPVLMVECLSFIRVWGSPWSIT